MSQNVGEKSSPSNSKDEQACQDGRLTNRHIQTLSFLQDVSRENKDLKIRLDKLENELAQCSELHILGKKTKQHIQKLKEDFQRHLDNNSKTLMQKHKEEIMRLISNKLEAQTEWLQEQETLQSSIRSLEENNALLTDQLERLKKHDLKVDVLNQQLDRTIAQVLELKSTNERLASENTSLSRTNASLKIAADKHQDCESDKERLGLELGEARQTIREYSFRMDQLETNLKESSHDKKRDSELEKMQRQLTKSAKESAEYRTQLAEKVEMERMLKDEMDKRAGYLEDELKERGRMLTFIEQLQHELRQRELEKSLMKPAMPPTGTSQGISFREFVQLKREVSQLKEENERLRLAKPLALPRLKVASPGGDCRERNGRGNKHSATSSKSSILSIANRNR